MPCAWTVHATAQHHTVISTALPVSQFAPGRATGYNGLYGLDGRFGCLGGSPVALIQWFLGGSLAPLPSLPVPGFGSGPRSESGSLAGTVVDGCASSPRPDPDGAGLIFGVVAKDSGGRRRTHTQKQERGGRIKERVGELGELVHAHVPCVLPMLCCAAFVLCCC